MKLTEVADSEHAWIVTAALVFLLSSLLHEELPGSSVFWQYNKKPTEAQSTQFQLPNNQVHRNPSYALGLRKEHHW